MAATKEPPAIVTTKGGARINPALKRHLVPLSKLKQDPDNVREHPDFELDALVSAFERIGQQHAIIYDKATGVVWAGNARLKAAIRMGWKEMAAIPFAGTRDEARAFAIGDNRIAELSDWNYDGLSEQIGGLLDAGLGFEPLMLGFDDASMLTLGLGQAEEPETETQGGQTTDDDDEQPEKVPAITKPGEIVEMGRHVLHCGDCIEVMRGMDEASVDSLVTSPPYAQQRASQYGGIDEEDYPDWCVAWMAEVGRVLAPTGSVLINIREHVRDGQLSDYVHLTRLALRAAGWVECDELIWVKPASLPLGDIKRPRRSWERILWFSRTNRPHIFPLANGRESDEVGFRGGGSTAQWTSERFDVAPGVARCPDFVSIGVGRTDKDAPPTGHPAVFPSSLARWMIRLVTPPGGVVLDPFSGSGTGLVAAEREGFRGIAIEREPEYCDIIRARVEHACATSS